MQIFDFHLHPGYDFHGPALGYQEFTDALKQDGITKCAGSCTTAAGKKLPVSEYAQLIPEYNRLAWEFHQQDPDFFIPGIHIHPDHLQMSVEEIQKHHRQGGILIGELVPYMMGWDYAHKNLYELLSYICELNMVVCIHPHRDFARIEAIMENFPDLKLVIAHLSGYELYEQELALMRKYQSVYTDLSAHGTDFDGTVADAVNKVGSERILYGTDYPGYESRPFIDIVINAPISQEEKENILYRNAAKLLCTN